MATRNLDAADWLIVDDDRDRDLVRKQVLLAERHAEVFAALDTPAVAAASLEVLELVLAATGTVTVPTDLHPLDAAGRLVQEDLCLMVLRDGAPHLDAASLCFPSYWRLADKLGRPMAEVHGPVAHYGDELAAKVDTFLQRLRPERPVWRRNWSIHDDPTYFLPDPTPPYAGTPPEGLYLRSERQTLRRLTTAPTSCSSRSAPSRCRWTSSPSDPTSPTAWPTPSRTGPPTLAAYKGDHGALAAQPWLASR